MRGRLAVTAAAALALAGLAGCGGSETVTQTVTTDELPTTTQATTAVAPTTTSVEPAASVDEGRLPAPGAVPGTQSGEVRALDDAQEFVDALYQVGDPAKPAARSRLEAAGYADGILRDELGSDPSSGIALFRSYAIALGDANRAQVEVDDAADEVESASSATSSDLPIDIPGGRALRLDIDQGGNTASVVLVTFSSGPYVYGLQGVSASTGSLPQDEILGVARDLYAQVSATP